MTNKFISVFKGLVSLVTGVTGILPVANGGTGLATLTANNVILGNGTGNVTFVAPGTDNNYLRSNGTIWVSEAVAAGAAKSFIINPMPGASFSIGTDLQYIGINDTTQTATETLIQCYMPLGFTWSNLSANITAYTLDVATTIKTRIATGDGTQVITINATGTFEDVTNT